MPPMAYFGAKTRLAERIVALMPPHDHYVEPFAGSLAVLLAKPPSKMETVNDLDGDIVAFWRCVRDRGDELAAVCALTPHAREEFRDCRDLAADDDLERARRVWVRLTQGRSAAMRADTGWRHYQDAGGSTYSFPRYLAAYADRIPPAAMRLRLVQIECLPALEVIARYGRHPETLIYADPPYPVSVRRGRRYRHELASEDEHRGLADALRACEAAVMLSGYRCDLYDELYGDWHRVEFDAFTGNGAANGREHGARTEVLWSNRPLGHDRLW